MRLATSKSNPLDLKAPAREAAQAGNSVAVAALADYVDAVVDAVVSFERDAVALGAVIGCTFEDAAAELRKREAAGQSRHVVIGMAMQGWTPWGGWPPPAPSVECFVAMGRRLQRFDWRRIWCALTDHVLSDGPGAPDPFCPRCGFSGYWSTRWTIGRCVDGLLNWCRRRISDDETPF